MTSEAEPALHLAPLLQGLDAAGASCIAADDRSGRIAIVRGNTVELRVLDDSNSSVQVSCILGQQSLPLCHCNGRCRGILQAKSRLTCWPQPACLRLICLWRFRRRCSCTRGRRWRPCASHRTVGWLCSGPPATLRLWTPSLVAPSCRRANPKPLTPTAARAMLCLTALQEVILSALVLRHTCRACSRMCRSASVVGSWVQQQSTHLHSNSTGSGFESGHIVLQAARSRAPIRAAFWTDSAAGDLALATAAGLELYRSAPGTSC